MRRLLVLIHIGALLFLIKTSKGWNHILLCSASRLPAFYMTVCGDMAECARQERGTGRFLLFILSIWLNRTDS